LNRGERKAEVLELADPTHADDRVGAEEPVAPLRTGVGAKDPELFVQVDGADGFAAELRQVPDLKQPLFPLVCRGFDHLPRRVPSDRNCWGIGQWQAVGLVIGGPGHEFAQNLTLTYG
jgi:hypothetical protein